MQHIGIIISYHWYRSKMNLARSWIRLTVDVCECVGTKILGMCVSCAANPTGQPGLK